MQTRRIPALRSASALLAALLLIGCAFSVSDERAARQVDVASVDLDAESGSPILLLKERGGLQRELPIWIGQFEALSIALATEKISAPRPNSHDLIKNLLEKMQGRIARVIVTELRGNTYYAVIELEIDGQTVEVDSRPSDAIAVAIRAGTPIFASDDVLRQVERIPHAEDAVDIDWLKDPAPHPAPSTSEKKRLRFQMSSVAVALGLPVHRMR